VLIAQQDESVLQPIKIQLLRTREQNAGTGIFYHVPLRRTVLVPKRNEDWFNPEFNLTAAGLSSDIGGQFSYVPEGYKQVPLFGILGTVVETGPIKIATTEGEVVHRSVDGRACMMEILEEDLILLQEQNQMTLVLSANAIIQFNAQQYGEGFTEDGRDRSILRGSVWAVPQYYRIGFSRTEARSAAANAEEIDAILEYASHRDTQRAMSARAESFANRAERDERRAAGPMPIRRGTNNSLFTR
jgi:hypothetical protein